jgi:hypothetical protein
VVKEFGEYDVENTAFVTSGRWSLSVAVPVSAGDHMVGVQGQFMDFHKVSSVPGFPRALLGELSGSPAHGTLTAVVLKQ